MPSTGAPWLDAILYLAGLLVGGGALAAWVSRRVRPVDPLSVLVDQVQEERAEDRKERAENRARIDRVERNQRITIDYVHTLRQHIAEGKPPPPPPWPPELNA